MPGLCLVCGHGIACPVFVPSTCAWYHSLRARGRPAWSRVDASYGVAFLRTSCFVFHRVHLALCCGVCYCHVLLLCVPGTVCLVSWAGVASLGYVSASIPGMNVTRVPSVRVYSRFVGCHCVPGFVCPELCAWVARLALFDSTWLVCRSNPMCLAGGHRCVVCVLCPVCVPDTCPQVFGSGAVGPRMSTCGVFQGVILAIVVAPVPGVVCPAWHCVLGCVCPAPSNPIVWFASEAPEGRELPAGCGHQCGGGAPRAGLLTALCITFFQITFPLCLPFPMGHRWNSGGSLVGEPCFSLRPLLISSQAPSGARLLTQTSACCPVVP